MAIKFIGTKPLIESSFETATVEECLEWCKNTQIIGVDTETIGDCWSGHIFCIQLGNKELQYVIDCTLVDIKIFKDILEDNNKLFLLQNAKYDLKFLYVKGIKIKNLYDTFLVECILTTGKEKRELGLKALAKKYCNVELDKTIRGKINYLGLTDEVIQYAAMDVEFLEDIMNKQIEQLKYWDLESVANLENNVTKVFAEMEYYGMKLDVEKWLIQAERREKEAYKFEEELNKYILNDPKKFKRFIENQLDLFSDETKTRINWNSSRQVIQVFNKAGLHTNSVNEKKIEKYKAKYPLVDLYLKYKENKTSISKFGKDFLKWINPLTKRVHTSYWQILQTGRVSSGQKNEAVNMQQIPALNEVRNCFIAEEGYSYVDYDYSSMELVIAAYVSGEDSWIDAFENNLDLHSVVAAQIYGAEWTFAAEKDCSFAKDKTKCNCTEHKEMRSKTKNTNYLMLYGGGPQKLSETANISIEEAKELIKNYLKGLPKLAAFLKMLQNYGTKHLYIRTKPPYRRIRWFDNPFGDQARLSTIERQSTNSYVQGTGANIVKLAMVKMWNYREKTGFDVKFVLQLHDAIVCESSDHLVEIWSQVTEKCMRDAFIEVIGHTIGVDGYVEKYWKK